MPGFITVTCHTEARAEPTKEWVRLETAADGGQWSAKFDRARTTARVLHQPDASPALRLFHFKTRPAVPRPNPLDAENTPRNVKRPD